MNAEAQLNNPMKVGKEVVSKFASSEFAMAPILMVILLLFSLLRPEMLSLGNLTNVFNQSVVVIIAGIGATLIILTAGIDLSAGSVIGASGFTAATVISGTGSVTLGIVAALLAGLLSGSLAGILIGLLGQVPFAITLVFQFVVYGVVLWMSSGATVSTGNSALVQWYYGKFGPIPNPVVVALLLVILFHWLTHHTIWGRQVILVGTNLKASQVSGIRTGLVLSSVYSVAGICYGIAGVILTFNLGAANAGMGTPFLMNIIGAVVLGGTSLFGGAGGVVRTAIGALILGFLANGMNLLGVPSYDQQIVTGAAIILAIGIDALSKRRQAK